MYAIDTLSNTPSLTVVTVVYNCFNEIAKTIGSVLSQDFPNIEYIIIDGNSNDGTQEIILEYIDKIDIFISESDNGIYDAMNKGVLLAHGNYLLFMNAGDYFSNINSVSNAMQYIEPGIDEIIFGNWFRKNHGSILELKSPDLIKGLFNHQSVIYSRNIHNWHGMYTNISGFTTADYFFFAPLFESPKVKCKIIDTPLSVIDVNGVSSGPQTIIQKYCIDLMLGRTTKIVFIFTLLMLPIYRLMKAALGK